MKKSLLFLGVLLLTCGALRAETTTLDPVIVTATRTAEEALTAPGHVTVLSEEEISRSGAKNLADLLTRFPAE